jgi:hypothetical protein
MMPFFYTAKFTYSKCKCGNECTKRIKDGKYLTLVFFLPLNLRTKKWQVTYIAPLQPSTLAAFLPWGSLIGAGRIRLADAKVGEYN